MFPRTIVRILNDQSTIQTDCNHLLIDPFDFCINPQLIFYFKPAFIEFELIDLIRHLGYVLFDGTFLFVLFQQLNYWLQLSLFYSIRQTQMGVPAFFRWLTVRYPQVVVDALTEDALEVLHAEYQAMKNAQAADKQQMDKELEMAKELRISQNNPTVDNLYLDMNGIIHPCCHPQDKPQPKSENEMFNLIFEYVDKIIDIVKPKKVLYLAIDGVAPRAKMNQQRSRRFRTALDVQEKADREAAIRNKWSQEGIKFLDHNQQSKTDAFDSNVITPGTQFMDNLSKALQLYIVKRLKDSSQWIGLKVIFSDAFVPGEGEHKILDFIRSQRAQKDYNGSTSHCIHGADADLIMLGLSTHEPNFYILRETPPQSGNQNRHRDRDRKGDGPDNAEKEQQQAVAEFQFVKLSVIREYLYLEYKDLNLPFAFDLERLIDDFVFLCFFVGNDFLPHLPSLSIREGAIDALMFMYKNQLPSLGDYLTDGAGGLNFSKVDVLLHQVATVEEEFFKQHQRNAERNEMRRKQDEERQRHAEEQKQQEQFRQLQREQASQQKQTQPLGDSYLQTTISQQNQSQIGQTSHPDLKKKSSEELEQKARTEILENIMKQDDLDDDQKKFQATQKLKELAKMQVEAKQQQLVEAYEDKVQLTKEGWKRRYYNEKFHVTTDEQFQSFSKEIRQAYIEGLAWVLAYYYQGCRSWSWFYPYHYAPFASDLLGCDSLTIKFDLGIPAKPFQQLLAVFPKQSSHALPSCYHQLYEPESEVIDFYPSQVELDLNGARYAWMGVNLLPFIEWDRLLQAASKADQNEELLTPAERIRNKPTGEVRLFFQQEDSQTKSDLQSKLINQQLAESSANQTKIEAKYSKHDGIEGVVCIPEGISGGIVHDGKQPEKSRNYRSLLGREFQDDANDDQSDNLDQSNQVVLMVYYHLPEYKSHIPALLPNVVHPKREVQDFAIYQIDRRMFQGEVAIKIVERVFGIDASQDPVYRFLGQRQSFNNGRHGYRNNHAVYDGGAAGGGMPRIGQRRRHHEFEQAANQRDDDHGSNNYHAAKRARHSPGRYEQNQSQRIDYNIRSRGAAQNQNSVLQNYMRRLEESGGESGAPANQLPQLLDRFKNDGHNSQGRERNNNGGSNVLSMPNQMPGQQVLAKLEHGGRSLGPQDFDQRNQRRDNTNQNDRFSNSYRSYGSRGQNQDHWQNQGSNQSQFGNRYQDQSANRGGGPYRGRGDGGQRNWHRDGNHHGYR